MPFGLFNLLKWPLRFFMGGPTSIIGAGIGALAGYELSHHTHYGRRRTIKGRVILDEHGNVIDVIRTRRKKPKRLPKYAYQALKNQAKLTQKLADFIEVMMFKELAENSK